MFYPRQFFLSFDLSAHVHESCTSCKLNCFVPLFSPLFLIQTFHIPASSIKTYCLHYMISMKPSKTSTWKPIPTNLIVSYIVSVLIYANLSTPSLSLSSGSKLLENRNHMKTSCLFPKCPTIDSGNQTVFLPTSITKCSLFGDAYQNHRYRF